MHAICAKFSPPAASCSGHQTNGRARFEWGAAPLAENVQIADRQISPESLLPVWNNPKIPQGINVT